MNEEKETNQNGLDQWIHTHSDELRNETEWLKDGDNIINVTHIQKVSTITKQFGDDDEPKIAVRYIYEYEDGKKIELPYQAHKQIVEMRREYGDKIKEYKVTRTGSGLGTRYTVKPIISTEN